MCVCVQFCSAGLIRGLLVGKKKNNNDNKKKKKSQFALAELLIPFSSVWEVFARSCKWISDLGNNMFVHSLGDSSVGVVQAHGDPAQL